MIIPIYQYVDMIYQSKVTLIKNVNRKKNDIMYITFNMSTITLQRNVSIMLLREIIPDDRFKVDWK